MFDFKTILTGRPDRVEEPGHPPAYEYTTYPKRFVSYRWFKPILTMLVAVLLWGIFSIILSLVAQAMSGNPEFLNTLDGGYDNMDIFSPAGALANFGILALAIPSVALALLVTRERPFSSLSSSCGGWRWPLFWKCLGVAAALYAVAIPLQALVSPSDAASGTVMFSVAGFVVCAVLVPFQCMAEEYVFRGVLMQAFGSWFRFPVIAVVLQSLLFMAGHPYNAMGMAAIFVNGIAFGVVAMMSRGLEAPGAYHIVNNLTAFLLVGFGLSVTTSEITPIDMVFAIALDIAYVTIMVLADRKWGWFGAKADGPLEYNAKRIASMAPGKVAAAAARGAVLPAAPSVTSAFPFAGTGQASRMQPPQQGGAPAWSQGAYGAPQSMPEDPAGWQPPDGGQAGGWPGR